MAILNNSNAISSGGYDINNSLRFRASASAYLNRTPASAGNRTTWTWSAWVKRGSLSVQQAVFFAGNVGTGSNYTNITFNTDNTFTFENIVSGVGSPQLITTQVFRDPSAWYHIVAVYDSTQATSSNRAKLYINGTQVTAFGTATYPSLNQTSFVNSTEAHLIGASRGPANYFDGYLTEQNFIDGQALTPSSFGETDTTTGVWKPKAYTGTYGTNGFYLKFSDIATTSGSNAGLGKDFSGNANYWTTNNISVTAGSTYDAMIDSPTLTSETVANYCVLNSLTGDATESAGNLNLTGTDVSTIGTMAFASTGKWYFEMTLVSNAPSSNNDGVGIANFPINDTSSSKVYYIYRSGGFKLQTGGSNTAYGATYATGDVIGVAYDADAGTLVFYKNNSSQGTAFTGISGTFFPVIYARGTTSAPTLAFNAGQRPFTYTPPTGFVRLNTYNLPDSTIKKGNTVMDATLYTGTGATATITNAAGFRPDLVWNKGRSSAVDHCLTDSNRGANKQLVSNTTGAELTNTNQVTGFNSNGFSLGADNLGYSNFNGITYVGWQWQAGQGTNTTNTAGSITSTVSVNATAGFSVVTYTGTGANATVGHGLGVAPKMIILKPRSAVDGWMSYHFELGNTKYILLNSTAAAAVGSGAWNNTSPTSSVFTIGTSGNVNTNGVTMVGYCWAEIAGFSKAFSYTGNGSADGVFVYLGFRPKFVMTKRTDTTSDWIIYDTSRNTYNVTDLRLFPNLSNAETQAGAMDLLSNGFKLRDTGASQNASGGTYIGMAWAENPLKNSNAR